MDPDQTNEIFRLICSSSELVNIESTYIPLMTELNLIDKHTDPTKLEKINLTLKELSAEELLKQILHVWWERFGNTANIQTLISSFENVGYVDIPTLLLEYIRQMKLKNIQRKRFPIHIKSSNLIQKDNIVRMPSTCKYYKDPTRSDAESVHLLVSADDLGDEQRQKSSGWKMFNAHDKPWRELLNGHTRRSICKYVSIFILFQVCIALSLHAQLRTLTKQISVQTVNQEADNKQCPNITVRSYIEYQMKMNQLSENLCLVNVFIDLNTNSDWQFGVPLKDPEKILQLKLRGDIPLNLLISILQETKQLKELIITNSYDGICDTAIRLNASFAHKVVNLKNLESITLENSTTCSGIYEFISENAHMKAFQRFQIKSGVVNDQNVGFIRDILESNSQRLKTLYFSDTKWNFVVFGNIVPVFSNVENIRLDFISDNNNSLPFMSTKFSDMFPNLKIFESKKGMMPWTFFQRLLKLRHITKVVVTVNVPAHYSKPIKMNFLNKASLSLKQLDITFYFPNKQYTDFCEMEGIENERARFSLFLVKANCKIRHV